MNRYLLPTAAIVIGGSVLYVQYRYGLWEPVFKMRLSKDDDHEQPPSLKGDDHEQPRIADSSSARDVQLFISEPLPENNWVYRSWKTISTLATENASISDLARRLTCLIPLSFCGVLLFLWVKITRTKRPELDIREARLADREAELNDHQAKLAELEAQLDDYQAKQDNRDDQLKNRQAKLAELKAQLDDRQAEQDNRDDQLNNHQAKLAEFQVQLDDRQAELAELERELAVLETQLDDRDHQLNDRQAKQINREAQLGDRQVELAEQELPKEQDELPEEQDEPPEEQNELLGEHSGLVENPVLLSEEELQRLAQKYRRLVSMRNRKRIRWLEKYGNLDDFILPELTEEEDLARRCRNFVENRKYRDNHRPGRLERRLKRRARDALSGEDPLLGNQSRKRRRLLE